MKESIISNIELDISLNDDAPNPEQMKSFAANYSKEQWNLLCKNKEFLDYFTEDLKTAGEIANNLIKDNK